MNKTRTLILGSLVLSTALLAAETKPFEFSVFSPVQIQKPETEITGLRINLIMGRSAALKGMDMGFVNFIDGDVTGLQCGFGSVISGDLLGYQYGLIAQTYGEVRGWQGGWFCQTGSVGGVQSGVVSLCQEIHGAQFGMILNHCQAAEGFQFGLFNHCGSLTGLQIGLINHAANSSHPWLPLINWN